MLTVLTPLLSNPENSKGSIGHAFTFSTRTENRNITCFYPSTLYEKSFLTYSIFGYLRCLVEDDGPSEATSKSIAHYRIFNFLLPLCPDFPFSPTLSRMVGDNSLSVSSSRFSCQLQLLTPNEDGTSKPPSVISEISISPSIDKYTPFQCALF